MKRFPFLLTILLTFLTRQATSQSMIHDALAIRNYYNQSTKKLSRADDSIRAYTTLMKSYLPDSIKRNLAVDAVLTIYNDDANNPFFRDLLPHGIGEGFRSTGTASSALSGFLNADVTQVADGIAKFLVKRTKEELSAAFFEQFKDDMNSDKYADLHILFPQTARLLNLIDDKIYQFSAYLTSLREAFILDLNTLPTSALVVMNLPKYKAYFSAHPELQSALQSGLFISNLLLSKDSLRHIGNVLDSMRIDQFFPLANGRAFDSVVNGSLKTARLISNSLRSLDTTGLSANTQRYWVTADSLFAVLNDPIAFKIYLGLLYQQAYTEDISFSPGKKLINVFTTAASFTDSIQTAITAFYSDINSFEDYRQQFKDIQSGLQKDSPEIYYYGMLTSSITIIESGLGFIEKIKPGFADAIKKIIPPVTDAGEMALYIKQKKYAPAILSLVNLYKDIFTEAAESEKTNFNLTKLLSRLSTYGTFISGVAKAENSDEVADIIEKTVLPTGSSYIKKHSVFNISLQAYTGVYGGQQRQATDKKFVTAAGVYAPLGVAASWGSRPVSEKSGYKNPSSFSLFVSIIDLGPLVTYRFSNADDSLANDIHIRLNQVLSPGVHLVYGFPKVPLSFGIGGNWTPLLTKVESNAIHVLDIDKRPFRWEAFLAVDIPFFNFYNKPR